MKFNIFNLIQETKLLKIEELKKSRLLKRRIENDKKSRKYIFEINQRYRKWADKTIKLS